MAQCDIAGAKLGTSCCHLPFSTCDAPLLSAACDKTLTPDEIDALLADHGIQAVPQNGPLDETALQDAIGANKPVMVWITAGSSSTHHVMLVVGRSGSEYMLANPCEADFSLASYAGILDGGRGPWQHSWTCAAVAAPAEAPLVVAEALDDAPLAARVAFVVGREGGAIERRESFEIWQLRGLLGRADESMTSRLAFTGRWHHQIHRDGVAVAVAVSESERLGDGPLVHLSASPQAAIVSRALKELPPAAAPLRLVNAPAYQVTALWMLNDGADRFLVLTCPTIRAAIPAHPLSAEAFARLLAAAYTSTDPPA